MGVITETERQKYFAYLDGVADGLNESRNDVNEVLDKIRAEIVDMWQHEPCAIEGGCLDEVLEVIDKYRGENE